MNGFHMYSIANTAQDGNKRYVDQRFLLCRSYVPLCPLRYVPVIGSHITTHNTGPLENMQENVDDVEE